MRTAEEILADYREKGYSDEKIKVIAKWRKDPIRSEIYKLIGVNDQKPAEEQQLSFEDADIPVEKASGEDSEQPAEEPEADEQPPEDTMQQSTEITEAPEKEKTEAQAEPADLSEEKNPEAPVSDTAEPVSAETEAPAKEEKPAAAADEEKEEAGELHRAEDVLEEVSESEDGPAADFSQNSGAEKAAADTDGHENPAASVSLATEEAPASTPETSSLENDIRISRRDFLQKQKVSGRYELAVEAYDELEVVEEVVEELSYNTYEEDTDDLNAPLNIAAYDREKEEEHKQELETLYNSKTRLEKLVEELSTQLNERYTENKKLKEKIEAHEQSRSGSQDLQKMLCRKQRRLKKLNEMLGSREEELHRIKTKYNRKILSSAYDSQRKIKIYRAFACVSWMAAGVLLVFSLVFDVTPNLEPETSPGPGSVASKEEINELVKPAWSPPFADGGLEETELRRRGGQAYVDAETPPEKIEVDEVEDRVSDRTEKTEAREKRTRYVVKKDDTLWDISQKFYGTGHYYKDIAKDNEIVASQLQPGDIIYINKR